MANCFSAGVLIVGWTCSVIMAICAGGDRRRASTAAVSPAMPLPTTTISALSTLYCLCIVGIVPLPMCGTPLQCQLPCISPVPEHGLIHVSTNCGGARGLSGRTLHHTSLLLNCL